MSNSIHLGVGKSAVIEVCSMHAENILREKGDKPHHPRVLLLAHTGKAASLICKLIILYCTALKDIVFFFLKAVSQSMEHLTSTLAMKSHLPVTRSWQN